MTDNTVVRTAFLDMDRTLKAAGASATISAGEEQVTMGAVIPDGISGYVSQDPQKKVFPPSDETFERNEIEFHDDVVLDSIVNRLIAQWPEFRQLENARIDIVWKRKGGQSGGKLTFGKCNKLSGLAKFYGNFDFTIWIAADHVRDHAFNQFQLEALIYHELMHCGWELDEKTGETKWMVQAHDVTTFYNELTRYGTWTPELRALRQGYEQLALQAGEGE